MNADKARQLSHGADLVFYAAELSAISDAAKEGHRSILLRRPSKQMWRLVSFLRVLGYNVDPVHSAQEISVSW